MKTGLLAVTSANWGLNEICHQRDSTGMNGWKPGMVTPDRRIKGLRPRERVAQNGCCDQSVAQSGRYEPAARYDSGFAFN